MPEVPEGSVNPATANENSFAPADGQPLPATFRHTMETQLGANLSEIRVHENHAATHLNARAFTDGNHIYFAPGHYQPHTDNGQKLLAHEIVHTAQQGGKFNP